MIFQEFYMAQSGRDDLRLSQVLYVVPPVFFSLLQCSLRKTKSYDRQSSHPSTKIPFTATVTNKDTLNT